MLRLLDKFKGLASVYINKGDTCFLRHDLWGGVVPSQDCPHQFSFARQKNISAHRAREIIEIGRLFTLPISHETYKQLLSLAQALDF
jgi:hypothetical protein